MLDLTKILGSYSKIVKTYIRLSGTKGSSWVQIKSTRKGWEAPGGGEAHFCTLHVDSHHHLRVWACVIIPLRI